MARVESRLTARPGDPDPAPLVPARGRWRRRAVAACCLAYLIAVVGVWLLLRLTDRWWPATVLAFGPRWLLALPAAVLVPAALLGRRRWVVVPLAAAVVVAWPVMGFNVPWPRLVGPGDPQTGTPAGTPFRVLTLNMHYSEVAPAALDRLIAAEHPDAVAIQEWYGSSQSALRSAPGWSVHATHWLFLASRHPIRGVEVLGRDSKGKQALAARYDLDTPAGPVHLFSLHTASTREGVQRALRDVRETDDELQANSALRREQSAYVAGRAAECRGPVLVVGDFNTPPESVIFPEVWAGYTDAFAAAGWGWGYTFFGAHTGVRIDHVLAGPGWRCGGCRVGPNVGSPHRPVIADLVWVGGGPE